MQVALSVGVQRMVRSDTGGAGVMFTLDTETGFPDVVLINANWGLGETVVQGSVDPDEYTVFKPLLDVSPAAARSSAAHRRKGGEDGLQRKPTGSPTRTEQTRADSAPPRRARRRRHPQLARWAVAIEDHYGRPMDIEWARDGETGELYIVQARPETVQSRREAGALKTYSISEKGERLVTGHSIGDAIAAGKVCRLASADEIDRFVDGGVLVTGMTDPDWVPIMKRAAAIVTDHGGRTSHAAIVSRELGLPAIVGTGDATACSKDGREVTVSCAEGDRGFVYDGIAEFEARDIDLDDIPETRTEIMINLANPTAALRWWRLPSDGVGLARMEFIINNQIKAHPLALLHPDRVEDDAARRQLAALTAGWDDGAHYFVDKLAQGIGRIAASQYPRPVIVRMSDFKTNEYPPGRRRRVRAGGGQPDARLARRQPLLQRRLPRGLRAGVPGHHAGARRDGPGQRDRDDPVLPHPRGGRPGARGRCATRAWCAASDGLEVYVMAEIPSNIILAEDFAERFDGFSIGSNDLTQLTLGVDRDSERLPRCSTTATRR
jgi:pyruvate, water dikinase